MDLPPVHLGPASDQILVLRDDHRSSYVCEGHLLDHTLRARRPDDLWDFLRQRDFHPRVVHRLRATGFLRIFEIGRLQLDWSLITTLIERWRSETHTFHLPTKEATITLQDVQVLYGLRVDGLAVALPQYMRAMTRVQYLDLLGRYTGFRPQGEAVVIGGSHISVTAIRQHMELDELPQYSWGAAVLAYLYRSMCRASMGTQVDICGFLPLLQVWAWEGVLALQPSLPPLEPDEAPPFLPLATRFFKCPKHEGENCSYWEWEDEELPPRVSNLICSLKKEKEALIRERNALQKKVVDLENVMKLVDHG
ncbi:serine/threonine-protein phosphatase 7 long form homolog [Nicotiana sylvestris]|uniref:serine/threonine-protein phosphatase 7 long form homolog n=1 Tax=Nicotiana sylvestris TaxID=4096 RepID=UPI00388C8B1F